MSAIFSINVNNKMILQVLPNVVRVVKPDGTVPLRLNVIITYLVNQSLIITL